MISTIGLPLLVIAVAIMVLLESGKRVVGSISVLARSWRASEFVLSFVLVAFATSLPELSVGVSAALSGVPELSLGDIVGTNIINITLVIGVVAVLNPGTTIRDRDHFQKNRLFQLVTVLSPLVLLLDGTLGRFDAVILLGLFLWNVIRLFDIDDHILGRKVLRPHLAPYTTGAAASGRALYTQIGWLILGVVGLLASTHWIVWSAEELARAFLLPPVLIGVLIIATATSLPELTIGIRSALAGRGGITLGDVFGSATINSTFILAVVALINPIEITGLTFILVGIVTTVVIFCCVFFFLFTKQSLSRGEGIVLLVCYCAFLASQYWVV